ncbi:two-component system, cell cycle response regulator [uncultured Gammaproteobacteria bacterium]
MTAKPVVAREKIALLRASFLAKLPSRLEQALQLHQLVFNTYEAPAPSAAPSAAAELHRLLHSLKGTGATLGLRALAEEAARGEIIAILIADDLTLATPATGAEIYACLASLMDLVQAARAQAEAPTEAGRVREEITAPAFDLSHQPLSSDTAAGNEKPRVIFLCDDDKTLVDHLSAQLQCFNYQSVTFSDPDELRATLAHHPAHAIVMDIVFPGDESAGTNAVMTLNRDLVERVPTVFISARNDFDARLRAVRAGGAAYFSKPVDVMALVACLDALTIHKEPEPYRVLVIDDEPEVAMFHAHILEQAGMVVRLLHGHDTVLAELDDFHPDLVLIDLYMPQCNGRDLAQVIRQIPRWISLPIIFLSSETDKTKQFSAIRIGAEGFLTKPVLPAELITAVAVRSERMRDLRSLMVRDSLTGLFNHTTTTQMLENSLAVTNRLNKTLAVVMIDIDRFKLVNDTYGHIVGDQVLVALARILRERLRTSDIIGRYGGEEFAVVLRDVFLEEAIRIMDIIRHDFSQLRFHHNGVDFNCSFSAGISLSSREKSLIFLRSEADRALYQAKHEGRNRIVAATSS